MTKQEFLNHLARLGACSEALGYVRVHTSDDARAIWETCDRLDWLLWLGFEVGLRAEVRSLACDYAERALPIWESWAREHAPEHLDAPRAAVDAARRGERGACGAHAYAARAAYDAAASAARAYADAAAAYDARAYADAAAAYDAADAADAAADYADAAAASYAARAAYDAAASYAARAAYDAVAERAWQLAHARSVLTWDRIEQAMVAR